MIINEDQMMLEMGLAQGDLNGIDVDVKTLHDIYLDYMKIKDKLQDHAEHVARILNYCPEVNSVKWRAKDPSGLIKKIIRKKKDLTKNPKYAEIDVSNYKTIVTDLIGLRAIFLFKGLWGLVDEYIFKTLNVCPDNEITIYHANDDDLTFFEDTPLIREIGGTVYNYVLEQKDTRYRSIHYALLEDKHTGCKIELQTRSILDEAWGEIDHHVRYPDNEHNPELLRKMSILNGQMSGCEEYATQSYNYFSKLEVTKPEPNQNLENKNVVTEIIEDSAKIEDHVHDVINGNPYEVTDHILRLSKIIKSTQPLRSLEDFDKNKFFKKMQSISLALDNDSAANRISKIVDQALVKDIYPPSLFDKMENISLAWDNDSAANRISKIADQALVKDVYPPSLFDKMENINRILNNKKNNDED